MYDYLQIYDGPNETSSLLGRFCGKNLPGDLKGNSSQLTIQFSSDGTINKPGFCLHFFSGKKWELTFGKILAVLTYNHLGMQEYWNGMVWWDSNLAVAFALICPQWSRRMQQNCACKFNLLASLLYLSVFMMMMSWYGQTWCLPVRGSGWNFPGLALTTDITL